MAQQVAIIVVGSTMIDMMTYAERVPAEEPHQLSLGRRPHWRTAGAAEQECQSLLRLD